MDWLNLPLEALKLLTSLKNTGKLTIDVTYTPGDSSGTESFYNVDCCIGQWSAKRYVFRIYKDMRISGNYAYEYEWDKIDVNLPEFVQDFFSEELNDIENEEEREQMENHIIEFINRCSTRASLWIVLQLKQLDMTKLIFLDFLNKLHIQTESEFYGEELGPWSFKIKRSTGKKTLQLFPG